MSELEYTWLGHATALLSTPEDRHIIIDPFLDDNPAFPDEGLEVESLDGMLLTHGHFDHVADAGRLIENHQPELIGIFEVATYFESQGAETAVPMNEGGTYQSDALDVSFTAVHARHSSAMLDDDDQLVPGGNPLGWVLTFSNDRTLYISGDTNVFGDMALIDELYEPDVGVLPIGDHFTMGPKEAGKAVEFLNLDKIIPNHYGTFDVLTGTPQEFKAELPASDADRVHVVEPGETVSL